MDKNNQPLTNMDIETSVRYLPGEARQLLRGLCLFQGAFPPETAVEVFDPQGKYTEGKHSPVEDWLKMLWQRGFLEAEEKTFASGSMRLYRMLPEVRLYAEKHLEQEFEAGELHQAYGTAYISLLREVYQGMDHSPEWVWLAQQDWADFEQAAELVPEEEQGWYWLRWGWVASRSGDRRVGLGWLERAVEEAEGKDQELELTALNNLALVYRVIGRRQQALDLFERVLSIRRAVGDRAGEAAILNSLASVYQDIGQWQQALTLFEQALSIRQAFGDRAGEAITLNSMGRVYDAIGQPQQALSLFKESLTISRAVGNRAGEAATLNNLGKVYQATGQLQQALALYEQALPILKALGERVIEATTLNNMAAVYDTSGHWQEALDLYEQALTISRTVGDRAGEAATLNNMGYVYSHFQTGQSQRVIEVLKEAIQIDQEIQNVAEEAGHLYNLAVVYYRGQHPTEEAIPLLERSIRLLQTHNLPQDVGGKTLSQHQELLDQLMEGDAVVENEGKDTLPEDQLKIIVQNTIAVMTQMKEKLPEWRGAISMSLNQAKERGLPYDADLFSAILSLLDSGSPILPEVHPYADSLRAIHNGIAANGLDPETYGFMQIMMEWVNAGDWTASQKIADHYREILYQPQVESIFEALQKQFQARGQSEMARELAFYLALLQDCKTRGIAAAYERLEA
jgi:tetratricopeptide (TPR) repeat protein